MTPSLRHPGRVALLVLAAAALNFVVIDLPGEARFFLGPFVYLPLVLALPLPWAILSAAVPMAVTIHTLGHPFPFFLMTAEAAWLAFARERSRRSAVSLDASFWAVVGLPALVVFCYGLAKMPADLVAVIVAKLLFNQLAAVVLADFVLRQTRLRGWLTDRAVPRWRTRDIVFHSAFVLAMIPVASVAVGVTVLLWAYCRRADREVLVKTGQRIAQQLDLFVSTHEAAVTGLANTLSHGSGDTAIMIEELRRSHPEFTVLLVTDAAGSITHVSAPFSFERGAGTRVSDREYFTAARALDRTIVSRVFRGRVFGRDVLVAISAPIHDAQGGFAGVVAASLEVRAFAGQIASGTGDEGVGLIVADSADRVIFANAVAGLPVLAQLRHFSQGALLASGADARPVEFDQPDAQGRPTRFTAYLIRAAQHGLVVVAQRPLLAGFEGSGAVFLLFGSVSAGIIGAAAWVARGTRRRTAEPLEYFATSANRQAALRTVEPMTRQFADAPYEVWIVFHAFNELAVQLQATYAMLRRSNQELDRRVQERTAEVETARRQAEAANRSKTEFLAMTGHEIRTPLNAIIGLTDALLESAPDAAARERLRTIRSSSTRLLNVLNDLLDVSKIEAGKLELHAAPVALPELCREVHALFAARAAERGLRLELELTDAVPVWVRCDGPRLQQVLINLVGNALKFTAAGRVCLSIEALWTTEHETTLRMAVRDTGPGIPAEKIAGLFQPYVQLAHVDETAGTGLGLAISHRLVGLMGSELQVCSEPGYGAEFFFTLVLPRVAAPAPAAAAPIAFASPDLRVLVADDNPANQEVLRGALEDRCARLEIVDSATGALARLAQDAFDVALVDLAMPDADGLSVARTVRGWRGGEASRGCRLIAVSAHRRDEMLARCTEAGFDDYIEKPIERQELFRRLPPAAVAAG